MQISWTPPEKGEELALAIHNFVPDSSESIKYLPLLIGDIVEIRKTCKDWYYGCLKNDTTKDGIFPKAYVKIKTTNGSAGERISDSSVSALNFASTLLETPIEAETHAVVKQWLKVAKQLYVEGKNSDVTNLMAMIKNLLTWRKQLLSEKLPVDEMQKLKTKISRKIDVGNKQLGLDMALRDENGNLINLETCDVIELFELHSSAVEKIQRESKRNSNQPNFRKNQANWCILANIFEFTFKILADTEVFLSLYDAQNHCFISESFTMYLPHPGSSSNDGLPLSPTNSNTNSLSRRFSMSDGFNGCKILFTDFGHKDVNDRKRVFLVCKIVKFGNFDTANVVRRSSNTAVRQPCAIGAVDISEVINADCVSESPSESPHYEEPETQAFMQLHLCETKMEETLQKILDGRGTATVISAMNGSSNCNGHNGFASNNGGSVELRDQGILLSVQRLWGNAEEVQNNYANTFSRHPVIVRKLGFPDVISKDDVRNDLYVTLLNGDFKECGKDRNIEVKVTLVDESGNVFTENFISVSVITKREASFTSTVFYHDHKPRWNDMLKIVLPVEIYQELHLRFTFKHRSSNEAKDKNEKPFAVAFIRLMQDNGTALIDGDHTLNVYKCEKRWDESTSVGYLVLPPTKSDLENSLGLSSPYKPPLIQNGIFTLSSKDFFTIRTVMCSTSLTQNFELLGLLEWQTKRVNLKSSLESLMKHEKDNIGADIVKFLGDVLDVLFNILTTTDDYDEPAFDALVYVIGLVDEKKFHSFKPVMDNYLQHIFSAGLVHMKLLKLLNDYISNANKNANQLFIALKSLEYLMKFIVRSRIICINLKCADFPDSEFNALLRKMFELSADLFKKSVPQDPAVLKCQGAALKYLPLIVNDVMSVADAKEISILLTDILANVSIKNFPSQKLNYIKQLVNSELFIRHDLRRILLPAFLQSIKSTMENNDEYEYCALTLTDLMRILYSGTTISNVDNSDLADIVNIILRPLMQLIIRLPELKPLKPEVVPSTYTPRFVALLIATLDKLDATSYGVYVKSMLQTTTDVMDFVTELLMLMKDLIENCVYPQDWFHMITIQNSTFLKLLSFLATTIRVRFSSPFQASVCDHFFQTCVAFVTQKYLQLETFSHSKRVMLYKRFRDMRLSCAREIKAMWMQMDHVKKAVFIPGLVGQILSVTLIPHKELRQTTIPIFLDMIITSLYYKPGTMKEDSHHSYTVNKNAKLPEKYLELERELIYQLDHFVDTGHGDIDYSDSFISIMDVHLLNHKARITRDTGLRLTTIVQRLMQRLLEYRDVKLNHDCVDNRMNCLNNLLEFYRDNEQIDLYTHYLYKLYDLHMQGNCENFVEAACALKLRSDQLSWTEDLVKNRWDKEFIKIPNPKITIEERISQRRLKEALYYEIICLYDRGNLWEKAIDICKELQFQYEAQLDYEKMSLLLQKMARMYNDIITNKRAEPEYFYVAFYGKGFPSFLQNRFFVYRGQPYERIADFVARMTAQFPRATVLQNLAEPKEHDTLSNGQYFLICKVDPVVEENLKPSNGKNVDNKILWYYKYNEVQKFSFTRRLPPRKSFTAGNIEAEKEFLIWVERTVLVVKSSFPTLLRFSPVISKESVEMGPVQVALESMKTSAKQLSQIIDDFEKRSDDNMEKLLTLKLQGIVNPAVMGGIRNYEKTIFTKEFTSNCSERELTDIKEIKDLIATQIPLLEKGLYLLAVRCSESQRQLVDHMLESFDIYRKQVESNYGVKKSLLPDGTTLMNHMQSNKQQQSGRSGGTLTKHSSIDSGMDGHNTLSIASLSKKLIHESPMSGLWSTRSAGTVPRKTQNKRKQSQTIMERDFTPSTGGKRLSNTSIESTQSVEFTNSSCSSPKILEISETITPQRPPRPASNASSSNNNGKRSNASSNSNQHVRERLPSLIIHQPMSPREDIDDVTSPTSQSSVVIPRCDSVEKPPPLPPKRESGHGGPGGPSPAQILERCLSTDSGRSELTPPLSSSSFRAHNLVFPAKCKPLPPVPTAESKSTD